MILKIERIWDSRKVRLRLSGEFRSHHLDQVKAEISRGEPITLDLEEVDLVDIEAIRFLNAREDEGISVLHCSRPLHHRRSSFLPMQLCGVEIRSFLPNR